MPNQENDVERFKRIRDQQLRARDPQKGERRIHHEISTRHKRTREPMSFKKMFDDVPRKWTGLFLGAFLGFLILIFLPSFIDNRWVDLIGVGAMLFLALIGLAIGQAIDSKKELEDLIGK